MRILASISVLFLALCETPAQTFSIPRFTIEGGGGTATGGVFSVRATIAPPAAGSAMTNAHFSMTGGFLTPPVIVQTPGAPFLTMTPSGTNAVLAWAAAFPNCALVECANNSLNAWSAVSLPRSTNNGQISVLVPMAAAQSFFRLRKL